MWSSPRQYPTGTAPNEESGPLAENTPLTWQDYNGKGNSRQFFYNMVGKKFRIGNAWSLTEKKGLFLSVYVDDSSFCQDSFLSLMVCSLRTKCNVDDFTLVPELPRIGGGESYTSDEERPDNSENHLLELFAFPGSSPASQRHM